MKRYLSAIIALLISSSFLHSATNLSENPVRSRKIYVKNIYTDIYALNKRLDVLMHRRAFERNPSSLSYLDNEIKDTRYQRDILMYHLRKLRKYGFEQIHQIN